MSLRRKMEKRIKSQTSPPASHQDRHKKDPLPGRSSRVACPELEETPTSAMGVTGKVVEEVAARGKRPTLQNADHHLDGRAAPTKAAGGEKITVEVEEEKQKLSQNNGGRQDPGKAENIRRGSGEHNGIIKSSTEKSKLELMKPSSQITATEKSKHETTKPSQKITATEKPKLEQTKPSPQIIATEKPKVEATKPIHQITSTEKPDVKTAPWRQGRSGQQGEGKEKIVKGSKRQEQEAKVQEFLRDPNAPPGSSSVPLEVRLRKPGMIWMDGWIEIWKGRE